MDYKDAKNLLLKVDQHKAICEKLTNIYRIKNHDYGDSFEKTRSVVPNAILVRLMDKMNRLVSIYRKDTILVEDEKISDTLFDMANYCIMELIEMERENAASTSY